MEKLLCICRGYKSGIRYDFPQVRAVAYRLSATYLLLSAAKECSEKERFFYVLITVMQYCTFSLVRRTIPTKSLTSPMPGRICLIQISLLNCF